MAVDRDKIDQLIKDIGGAPPGSAPKAASKAEPPPDMEQEPLSEQFRTGVRQGLLGYVEAPAYYAEKGIRQFAPNFRMPLHEWARNYRNRAESTLTGVAGEMAGTAAPLFLPGLGELGFAGRAAMGAEDLARMARLAEEYKASEAARAGLMPRYLGGAEKAKAVAGRLQFTQPPAQPGSALAATMRPISNAWQAIGPLGRGAARGAGGALMTQPATSWEDARNRALLGGALGAGGAALRPSTIMSKYMGDGKWARRLTPAGRKEMARQLRAQIKAVRKGRGGHRDMQDIALRSAGFFGGHALGHAIPIPGLGWVGGHFLGEALPYLARLRHSPSDLSELARRSAIGITQHPGIYGAEASHLVPEFGDTEGEQ